MAFLPDGALAGPLGGALLVRQWGRICTEGRRRLDPYPETGAALDASAALARVGRLCLSVLGKRFRYRRGIIAWNRGLAEDDGDVAGFNLRHHLVLDRNQGDDAVPHVD